MTRLLTILLLYLLVVTSPVALVLLWRSRDYSLAGKMVWTVLMTVGLVALFLLPRTGLLTPG